MTDQIGVRVRSVAGDWGPSNFAVTATVNGVKERLLLDWPRDGTLGPDAPSSVSDIRLILGGKFLDNTENLEALRRALGGDPAETPVITMHVVIRQSLAGKQSGKAKEQEKTKGCSCVIC